MNIPKVSFHSVNSLFVYKPFEVDVSVYFCTMEKTRGKHFSSNEEVIAVVEEYFAGLVESHFHDGINKLEDRWTKCIDLMGDYTEQ